MKRKIDELYEKFPVDQTNSENPESSYKQQLPKSELWEIINALVSKNAAEKVQKLLKKIEEIPTANKTGSEQNNTEDQYSGEIQVIEEKVNNGLTTGDLLEFTEALTKVDVVGEAS